MIDSFFFKSKPKILLVLLARCLGEAQLASSLLFCRFDDLSGVCGVPKVCFSLRNIFPWRLAFSASFFETCDIFFTTNSAAVFVPFFVALVLAVLLWPCYERFVFFLVHFCCPR